MVEWQWSYKLGSAQLLYQRYCRVSLRVSGNLHTFPRKSTSTVCEIDPWYQGTADMEQRLETGAELQIKILKTDNRCWVVYCRTGSCIYDPWSRKSYCHHSGLWAACHSSLSISSYLKTIPLRIPSVKSSTRHEHALDKWYNHERWTSKLKTKPQEGSCLGFVSIH